ncbi:MAG TPA: hypothetical protein VME45_07355 [Stellaceae bacterium]|nr:hypothetical protein [Stellaceae bacterium]
MLKTIVAEAELPVGLNDLDSSIDLQIRSFLNGDNDGRELLRGLYGDAIDEPIPARLSGLLRR